MNTVKQTSSHEQAIASCGELRYIFVGEGKQWLALSPDLRSIGVHTLIRPIASPFVAPGIQSIPDIQM